MDSSCRNQFRHALLKAGKGKLAYADWRDADVFECDMDNPLMVILIKVHVQHNGSA